MNLKSLLALIPVWLPFAALQAAEKPNIVYILADDLGYGDVRTYNPQSKIPTPNLDRLASEGMRFTDAHAPSSVCTPTRYGLLTGRYSFRSRLKSGVLVSWDAPLIEEGRLTVPALLREHGYATTCIGKWHLGWTWPTKDGQPPTSKDGIGNVDFTKPITDGPLTYGFDTYFGTDVPNYPPYCFIENDRTVGIPAIASPQSKGGFNRPGPMVAGWSLTNIMPDLTTRAIRYLEAAGARSPQNPFFLYFPLTAPHYPIVPTPEFKGRSQAGDYGDFVAQVDWTVGEVMSVLARTGLATNTLVIFTSDNGPEVGEMAVGAYDRINLDGHRSMDGLRGVKRDVWEGGHRVPFIARWPNRIPAGAVSEETICHVDLMATCAALLGAKLPHDAAEDSYDILPALLGQKLSKPIREATVLHSAKGGFAIRQGDWVLIDARSGDNNREPDWFKKAHGYQTNHFAGELYNLRDDLAQSKNLYGEKPEIVAQLKTLLEEYKTKGRSAPLPKPKSATSQKSLGEPLIYKTVGDRELKLFLVKPEGWKSTDQRPGMVFFHGGGWVGGTPAQLSPQAEYLASRGMVCALVEYRLLKNKPGALPTDCVQDAKSAMRWVRSHASELGIDPQRIGAAGGSAGGHLAAFTGLVTGLDDPTDDLTVSPKPAAMVLFNPVFNNGPGQYGHGRFGERFMEFSPAHHITSNAPPAIVFLGTEDKLIPVKTVEAFKADMEKAGIHCETRFYEGVGHAFFNREPYRSLTLIEADKFLASLGWLQGPPTIQPGN